MADDLPDIEAARAAGYSDKEILAAVGPTMGADIGSALKAGYSASDVLNALVPPKPKEQPAPASAPKAEAAPEPVSGTMLGVTKVVGQSVLETPAGLKTGVGAIVKSAGQAEGVESKRDVSLMQRLDQGEDFGALMKAAPNDLARVALREYQIATPEQKAKIRQDAINTAAAPPGAVERAGTNILAAGEHLSETAKKLIPLTPEEESRSSVIIAKTATSLLTFLAAAGPAGVPGMVGYGGVESFGKTYEEAKKAGKSDEDATVAGAIGGVVQGGLNAVPAHKIMSVADQIPKAFKGEFLKTLTEMVKSGGTLLGFSQVSQLADNYIAKENFDPERKVTQGLGEHMGETFAAGALLPVVPAAAARMFRARTPAEVAKPIVEAKTTDEAITAAQNVVNEGVPVDIGETIRNAEYGTTTEQKQAQLLKLFGGRNEGTVEQTGDGNYQFRKVVNGEETAEPIKVWDPNAKPVEGETPSQTTITPELAKAQQDHYDSLGVKVVYFENDARIPFDGAVDPTQPNTIFLSNDPQRNAAQVGAHELTHLLETTKLPDGTNLGDLLHSQVREGMTPEGRAYAETLFGPGAPKREAFPEGIAGDSAHADAVVNHLVSELSADIGGEAPKFMSFAPKVVDAIEQRYGTEAAKGVLAKLIAGFKNALDTMRKFFSKPKEHPEYGQTPTVSQHWVTNLGEIHDTLAKMYAVKFGDRIERENAALATMREKVQRDRFLAGFDRPASEVPPPTAPEGFTAQRPAEVAAGPAVEAPAAAIAPEVPRPPGPMSDPAAYAEASSRATTLRRWLSDLDAERRSGATAGPQAALLRQTEASILAKVRGVEDRLTQTQAARLAEIRAQIDALHNPAGDSPDMAKVRQALDIERQRMADAASIGAPAAPIREAGNAQEGRKPDTGLPKTGRIQAVMPERGIVSDIPATVPERDNVSRETSADAPPRAATTPAVEPPPVSEHPQKVRAEKERVWTDKVIMGRTEPGIARNEQFATDIARERVMREEASEEVRQAVEDDGIPERAIPDIARMYRREDGQSPQEAFYKAVDRWVEMETAKGLHDISDGDAFGYDALKAEAGSDPVIRDMYAALDEHYAGSKEIPDAHEIPFGDEASRAREVRSGEAAPEARQEPEGDRAGGESGSGREVSGEARSVDDEPKFSPRQTETPEFREWFRNSKVVDADGKPEVVYHGTDKDFHAFDPEKSIGGLIWFTNDRAQIESGESGAAGRSKIMEMYASIQNPAGWREYDKFGIAELQARGFDGVILPEKDGTFTGIAFEPTQVKSATNNSGAFDLANPDIRMSPRVTDYHANPDRQYTPEQEKFNERQRATEVPTWGAWWDKIADRPVTKLAVATVDRYAGIKARDPEGYVGARIANSSEGAKAVWLTEGTLDINGRAYDLKDRTGGARGLLTPLKKEVHDFFFWVASHRAGELAAEDREHRFTPEDIAAGKTLNQGTLAFDYELSSGKTTRSREAAYMDSLAKLNTLNQNILDLSVKGGLLTRDVADVLMKNQFYVPFFRERADGTAEFVGPQGGMAKQTFGKKLTGGTEKLNSDLVQNWVDNASHIIDAVAKNRAAGQALEAGVKDGIATKLTEQQYNHLSDKQAKAESTWVMEDGTKQYYHVEDPMLFKAVGTLAALADPFYALSAARVARRVLQVGITHNPVFAARNLARDSLQALAVTPQSANVFNTIATGMRDSDTLGSLNNLARSVAGRELAASNLSEDAVRLLAGGGMMRIASLSDTGVSKVKVGSLLDTPEKMDGFLNHVSRAMHQYSESVGKGEEYNRIALYKNLREQGVPHDIASFSSQDLTDFSLGGANVIVRYIAATVPFTSSRAQGLYKVGRALSGSDARMFNALGASQAAPSAKSAAAVTLLRTAGTLAGLTVATMALDALYSNDPEYQQRSEYDRSNYWYFRVGEERFRIPMPFEVGALSRIAADTALAFFDKRMTVNRWASNTWASMQNNLGFGYIPQIVSPIIDVAWTGKSGTGQAIEPRGMENLRPDERYTVNNTMAARGASSAINGLLRALPGQGTVQGPSPMQLDYLTKAYGGWLGSAVLGTADTAIRSFTSEPTRPAGDTWATVTQGLVETSPRMASRYVDALYTQSVAVEQAFATYKDILQSGHGAEAQKFFKDNQELIQKHGLVSSVLRTEGQLNKQIRLITNNPDPRVTAEQKRIQIMQLQAMKSRAAEQVVGVR